MSIQDELAERDREIFRLRSEGMTLKAIGERFGIGGARVRQIFNAAEIRIRQAKARGEPAEFVPKSRYGAPKDWPKDQIEIARTEKQIALQEKRIANAEKAISALRDRLKKLKDQA